MLDLEEVLDVVGRIDRVGHHGLVLVEPVEGGLERVDALGTDGRSATMPMLIAPDDSGMSQTQYSWPMRWFVHIQRMGSNIRLCQSGSSDQSSILSPPRVEAMTS